MIIIKGINGIKSNDINGNEINDINGNDILWYNTCFGIIYCFFALNAYSLHLFI